MRQQLQPGLASTLAVQAPRGSGTRCTASPEQASQCCSTRWSTRLNHTLKHNGASQPRLRLETQTSQYLRGHPHLTTRQLRHCVSHLVPQVSFVRKKYVATLCSLLSTTSLSSQGLRCQSPGLQLYKLHCGQAITPDNRWQTCELWKTTQKVNNQIRHSDR